MGYRPDRIGALDWQTRRALAELRRLHSEDPAAAGAMRSILATVRTLDDHWMPLITAIRASEVMITWTRSALDTAIEADRFAQWQAFCASQNRFESMSDDQLIAEIFARNQHWPTPPGWYDDPDLGYGDDTELPLLMRALEARVEADASFGELLVDTAGNIDVLLLVFARGAFPTDLVAKAASVVVARPDSVGIDGLRRALLTDALLGRVAEDPGAALDMLLDVDVASRILAFDDGVDTWVNRPATPGVTALIHAGLVGAPTTRPDRQGDGFDAFGWFIERSNDMPVDRDGFPPGVAAGLAISMQHYVPTFIHSIDGSDSEGPLAQSGIHADRNGDGLDDALASYEEMTDLFGALLHDADAISLLGVLLAVTADDVAYDRRTLSSASHFAGLLRDAADNEDLEAAIASAARAAQQGQVTSLLASAIKLVPGVAGTTKTAFDVSIKFVAQLARAEGRSEPADSGFDPGSLTRHLVQMASIRRLATDARHRHDLGIESAPEDWNDVTTGLDELDELARSGASAKALQTARQRIFNQIRNLGGEEIMDELDEHGTLASLPNRDVAGD